MITQVSGLLLRDRLEYLISSDKIVLFMRGTEKFTICGLSSHISLLLRKCNQKFKGVDLIRSPEIHALLRELHAPLVAPYLYINGEFIGGYDELVLRLESGCQL